MKIKPAAQAGTVTVEMHRFDEELMDKGALPKAPPLLIRRIVVPIDFSSYSYKSLDYANAFARQSSADILLLHVVPLAYVDTEMIAVDYMQLQQQSVDAAQGRLEKLKEEHVDETLKREVRVRIGRPVDEIVSAAKEYDADLIIMSTHGYTGLKHAFLGSTTENVVRYAPCPVLTLRQNEHDFVASPPEKQQG